MNRGGRSRFGRAVPQTIQTRSKAPAVEWVWVSDGDARFSAIHRGAGTQTHNSSSATRSVPRPDLTPSTFNVLLTIDMLDKKSSPVLSSLCFRDERKGAGGTEFVVRTTDGLAVCDPVQPVGA
jgi:hypothetical protein